MYLTKNMLIRFAFPEQLITIERILWIDSTGSDVITIDISDPSALPISRSTQEIFDAFDDKNATILTQDPFSVIYSEDKIPETWRQKRDKAWNLIEPLFVNDITDLFNPSIRGKLIDELSKATGRRKSTIYSYLRRWWQGGQVINALLPHYDKCGNPGEEKKSTVNKLGRKNLLGKDDPASIGCNVDKDMKAKIFIGAGTFFETQKKSLRQAWRLTNKQYFMVKITTQDKVVLKLGEKYPSFDQFKYWYYKQRDYKESVLRREGERKTNLKYRPLSGRSSDISFGPGSIFQIDATMGDVNLVSVFNRLRLIGRPIVYLVVDVFSHLIVGFYVGIENMSKVCAMMALENTFTNKIHICQRYGVNISEDEWYCHHTPEALLADRAELAGYYGSQIVKNLGIDLANTAPYRADMKGLVEQLFNLLNIVAIHDIPGATSKHQERGDRDSRLDAILNIYEFTQLLIHAILYLNMRRLKNYPFKSDLVQQQVDLRPISLWHWGLAHRNGRLGVLDPTTIRTSLLPRKEASVRSNGIRFNGHTYTSPEIDHLFMKARKEGSWKVDIGYHPHIANNIYLYLPGQREAIRLKINEHEPEAFEQATFFDIDALNKDNKIADAKDVAPDLERRANFELESEQIKARAAQDKKLQKAKQGHMTKSAITKDVNENRQYERDKLRQLENDTLPQPYLSDSPLSSNNEEYIPAVYDLDKWKSRRRREQY